jgi:hypothetical protein
MRKKEEIARKLASSIQFIDIGENILTKKEIYSLIIPNSQGYIEHKGVRTPTIPQSKINIGFKKESFDIINQCVDEILSFDHQSLGPLYSCLDDDYVKDILIKIIIDVEETTDSNKYNLIFLKINDFFKNLEIQTFFSYIKIGNFHVTREYDFHSFKIFPNDKENWKQYIGDEDSPRNQNILHRNLKDSSFFQSILELQVQAADEKKATKNTIQTTTDILNILRVLGALGIVHEGDVQLRSHDIWLINKKKDQSFRHAGFDDPGKLGSVFDFDRFAQENPSIISKLQSCFDLENSTPLERKMKNSLIWLGESIFESHYSHKLLKMIISIESLLLDSNDRGTKSYLLEERAAFLFGKNYTMRSYAADTISEAYSVRNYIVHSGDKHPIPFLLIKRLFFIAFQLNMIFLTSKKFEKFGDVLLEVKNKKFQKPIENDNQDTKKI